nr:hypothetical protein [Tanacetum cinerariifolium]
MFKREKLSGNNFNDWFRQLKLVLRVEKNMYITELPILPALVADSTANEGKPVVAYVLKMKGYVEQLEHLGYVLLQDLSVGLILNGLISDFARFVRNYNMHNMRKKIGELHAMLIEYEKSLPKKGLRGAKKLEQGALYLYVGNGVRAQVEDIRSFDLVLPNGLVICLDNCHYAPTITRGVVLVHRLVENGFIQCFMNYGISVSKNDVLYFNAIPRDGIYEIDMHNLVPKFNSIYNVSNKRAKHNLDSTYLWHCRLAHISKKRIKKLQHDGLLKSTDDESLDQCVSCLSSKMTRKPFPHHTERVTDLLGIIHTNVFKNEVENQLEKTIKALRLNRGGEYISQKFKDYLKACGIVQQLTPSYTPQDN